MQELSISWILQSCLMHETCQGLFMGSNMEIIIKG